MKKWALYNEIDPFAAEWLENLILVGAIAPGVVDRRSIEDIAPSDLTEFCQVHFFAGIGIWSHALREAGWDDSRPCWTASCPCQPFSAAGKGTGFDDERHLWPALYHLATLCRPDVIFGEQVASKDGLAWLDVVHSDMEATGHAFGALDLCAAGVGAPHIRQRSFWVAQRLDDTASPRRFGSVGDAKGDSRNETRLRVSSAGKQTDGLEHGAGNGRIERRAEPSGRGVTGRRGVERLANTNGAGSTTGLPEPQEWEGRNASFAVDGSCEWPSAGQRPEIVGLVNANRPDAAEIGPSHDAQHEQWSAERGRSILAAGVGTGSGNFGGDHISRRNAIHVAEQLADVGRPGPTNGYWGNADWLGCRDGKWRPVESRTFPLAYGITNRVGTLRGYGNAIVGPLAKIFIETVMEYLDD